jgi:hypothetical protein
MAPRGWKGAKVYRAVRNGASVPKQENANPVQNQMRMPMIQLL